MDRQEMKFLFNYPEDYSKYLNSTELKYIASLKELYYATGVLTIRQVEYLYEIKEYLLKQGNAASVYESDYQHYPAQYATINYNAFV